MEKHERDIKIKRILTTIDTDGDGVDDTIAYLNKEDLFLPILLKQSIKDLGVYTDHKEKEETIDLGSFWVTSNDGTNDGGTNPIGSGITNTYDNGETDNTDSTLDQVGCMDMEALNYNENATEACNGCCNYYEDNTEGGGTGDGDGGDGGTGLDAGAGCYHLSSGCVETPPSYVDMAAAAADWCSGGCTNLITGCAPNGCGGTGCCPGPAGSFHVLTQSEAPDLDYNGTYANGCNCDGGGRFIIGVGSLGQLPYHDTGGCILSGDGSNDNPYVYGTTRRWKFYCVPN